MRSRLGLVRLNLKTEIAAARFAAAERLLVLDPTNWRALVALGEAATELGWVEAAVFAREAIAELRPDDQENLLAFGEALLAAGQPGAALVVAEKILARHPIDGAGLELLRHASIALTVETGNWEK
ncbi:MAG: hypothetical protein JWM32_2996 [Verrucomicrobia bacterium]|nr:hypothetical protein [Verrucomicrobiota bacterium]